LAQLDVGELVVLSRMIHQITSQTAQGAHTIT
jgi:hypothetical protein